MARQHGGLLAAILVIATFLSTQSAQAHFLFARILPPAEGGRAAEVYFSEKADAGDPRFIDKVAATRLWLQTSPGEVRELPVTKGADRLRAHLPIEGSVEIFGRLDYGVLARPAQPPFLLRHCPKAVAGKADELNRLEWRPGRPGSSSLRISTPIRSCSPCCSTRSRRPMPG